MTDPRKRVITAILAVALALTLAACDDADDGPGTTLPGDSETTAPVGS